MKKAGISFLVFSLFLILLFLLFTTVSVQASIFISEPNEAYNLGDSLDIAVRLYYSEYLHGFLRVNLVCDNLYLIYFSPVILEVNKEKKINIEFPVSEALGSCKISAALEDDENNELEQEDSSDLLLTDKININATVNKEEFEPSEDLKLEGLVIKENNNKVDGEINVFINGQEYSTSISKGEFSFTIELAEDIMPGAHEINLSTEDIKGNKGNTTLIFNVKQIPTYLKIDTGDEKFLPDNILTITPKLLDQAQQLMEGKINLEFISKESIIIFLSKDLILFEEKVDSGKDTVYRFAKNMPPGDYIITADFENLKTEKTVSVLEFENIDMELENTTLIVTNTGNVPYKKSIEVVFKIQGQVTKEIISLDLEVGEIKIFDLSAPKGTYNLEINSDGNATNFSDVPLTGDVIATVELDKKENLASNWFFWLFLLVAFLLLFSYFRLRKKTKYGIRKEKETKEKLHVKVVEHERRILGSQGEIDKDIKDIFNKHTEKLAARSIIPTLVYGTKQEVTVLLMSISGFEKFHDLKKKNPQMFNKILDKYFDVITNKIKNNQGVASLYGNNLVVFFNIVKQHRHDIAAIKTAQEIKKITAVFNESIKNTNIKLSTKIGINTGMATISSIGADQTVKYTPIGSTMTLAKALNKKAIENEILIPEKIYEGVSNIISAKKMMPLYLTGTKAINVYNIQDSTDTKVKERHKWYVDRSLNR